MGLRKPPTQPQQPMSTMDPQKKRQQRGTGFTNVSSILNANQGAGQKMGEKIGSNVAGQAQDIRQGIQQGASQFQAGKTAAGNTAQQNIQNVGQYQKGADEDQNVYENRLAAAGGDLNAAGQTMRDTSYTGPMGIENAGQLEARSANVAALGQMAGNRTGQSELLRNVVAGRGGYTRGQAGLDQLLLGKEGQQGLQQARRATTGLGQQATGTINSAATQATGLKSAIEQQKQGVAQGLQTGITGIQDLAQQQAQQYNTQGGKIQRLLQGKNENGTTMSAEDISRLPKEDMDLLNNLGQFGLNQEQSYYAKSPEEEANILQQITSGADLNQQNRYMGNQSMAAQNLAKLRGDQSTADNIASTKFNEKLFNPVNQETAGVRSKEIEQGDAEKRSRLSQQAALKTQADRFLNNARNPLGSGVNAHKRVASDMAEYQKYMNQLQAMGVDPNQSVGDIQGQISKATGKQKSLQQLALEKLGQRYNPVTKTAMAPEPVAQKPATPAPTTEAKPKNKGRSR